MLYIQNQLHRPGEGSYKKLKSYTSNTQLPKLTLQPYQTF